MKTVLLSLAVVLVCQNLALANGVTLDQVEVDPVPVGKNLIPNPGFEQSGSDGIPVGWQWDRRNTDATCTVDAAQAHTGRQSLRLKNGTAFGAQIYGTLWWKDPIPLTAGQAYTLSAWVRSGNPGICWIGGGSNWQFRLAVPPTHGRWQRIWMNLTPGPADVRFVPRINVDAATPGVWIDDLKLEEGSIPTPDLPTGQGITLEAAQPETEIQGDGPFQVSFLAAASQPVPHVAVDVSLEGAGSPLRREISLPAGVSRIRVEGAAIGETYEPHQMRVALQASSVSASADGSVRFLSSQYQEERLRRVQQDLPGLHDEILRRRKQDLSYPMVTYTVLQNFVGYVQADLDYQQNGAHPFVWRARAQLDDLEAMEARLRQELASSSPFPAVPRWTGTSRPVVSGPSFVGPTVTALDSMPEKRPIFFTGYGAFGQVKADIEKFPHYGVNIIQIEVGPSSIFPAPGVVSTAPIQELKGILTRAKRAGVAVNLLISPHYFPDWMLQKYPELRKRREGFLQYRLHAPEGQDLLKRYVAVLLQPLKDEPALQSICLSNEPVNVEEPCEAGTRDWHDWLQRRHGTVAALNQRWGSHYASFDQVPLPNPFQPPPVSPIWMDFVRFNQDFFAGWHRMLADAVHTVAPRLPVHAKTMTWTFFGDSTVRFGVDATLFGQLSDINGNDSANFYNSQPSDFAQDWQQNAMGYDLQRSVKDAPVFNSENHVLRDRDNSPVPASHIRAALWQGAIHGESATTLWVWERTFDPGSDFMGNIMHRPACAEAVGLVNLDLNRAAREVTALQAAPPQVLLLQSSTAAVWDGGRYADCLNKLYAALDFTGLKVGFVTERQLESGLLPSASVLFVPNVSHLSQLAFDTLRRYRGRVELVGALLSRDEYDHPLLGSIHGESFPFEYGKSTWQQLWAAIIQRLPTWKLQPPILVRDFSGSPLWGVEWRTAPWKGGTLVNLCNERSQPITVLLQRGGRPIHGINVLTGQPLPDRMTLQPLEVRLIRAAG